MTKIDIFSGFLGAGKTTLIKKLIREAYTGEKLVLIENEFGEIGIDGGFMKEAGIEITEMNSGCICCSLVGDFTQSLQQVLEQFAPNRILIEPSGVGKLSDVIKAVRKVESEDVKLNSFTTVADAGKCRIYAKNFGEFYNDQIEHAGCIVLSRTGGITQEKLDAALFLLRETNKDAVIITTPWDQLDGMTILSAMERKTTLVTEMEELAEESCPVCGHHHHNDDEDEHHHHHEHDHGHHHHEHNHDHHHDGECHCHEHHHEHDHHHAEDVFDSWGVETTGVYTAEEIQTALHRLDDSHDYGTVLRAKGIVAGADGNWIHFDYVPGSVDVRSGSADVIGRICVIGSDINKGALNSLFHISGAEA